jgi:uncharacterized protein (TIGR02145 family)
MKKIFVIFAMLFSVCSLHSQEQKMVIELQDGTTVEYDINDIDSYAYKYSEVAIIINIYLNDNSFVFYDSGKIDSLNFSSADQALFIFQDSETHEYKFADIDRIEFKKKQNDVTFSTVQLCDQLWMAENLKVTHYRNGDEIPQVTDPNEWIGLTTGAWCYYNNEATNDDYNGKLYNWYAVNDPRGLAPEGWHVPSDAEWQELEICIGMEQSQTEKMGYRGTNEGSKLAGSYLWKTGELTNDPDFGSSGFNAVPGGYRFYMDGKFYYERQASLFWTSDEDPYNYSIFRNLFYLNTTIYRYNDKKTYGLSVRCVKD